MRDFISPAPGASLSLQDLPAPVVAVSYPMELVEGSPVGHSVVNGATCGSSLPMQLSPRSKTPSCRRVVPGSQNWHGPIPSAADE